MTLRRLPPGSKLSTSTPHGASRNGANSSRALDSSLSARSTELETTRNRSLSALSIPSIGSNTFRTAVSTVITAHSLRSAILPDMSLISQQQPATSLTTPLIPLKDSHLSPIPQSPPSISIMTPGTPIPRPRRSQEAGGLAKSAPNKETDYFTVAKAKRFSSSGTALDDFSAWGGPGSKDQDKEVSTPQTPSTPSGGGFIGRLRHFGRSTKRPLSGEVASTPGGTVTRQSSESHDDTKKVSHFQHPCQFSFFYLFKFLLSGRSD